MNKSIFKFSLDIHKPESQILLNIKRLDASRELHISLTENGRPYQITSDCSAVFTARKPDGNPIYNDCAIEGNVIVYEVTPQTVSCIGETGCEIRLFNNEGGLITSPRFSILVGYTIYNGEEIADSAPEFDALHNRIVKSDELYNTIKSAYESGELNGKDGEKGEKGDKGDKGDKGEDGKDGKDGDGGIPVVHELPTEAADGDMCLYSPANTIEPSDSGKRIYFDWEEIITFITENLSAGEQALIQTFKNNLLGFKIEQHYDAVSISDTLDFTYTSEDKYYELIIEFENGNFKTATKKFVGVPEKNDVIYSSIDELPKYVDISEFDEVVYDGKVCGVYAPYRLMVYRAGEWQRVETLLDMPSNDSYIPADKIELTTETATLEPNTHYSFGEVATLTLEFAEGDSAKVNEYMFSFTSGETATVLTLPSSVQWANELTVEANKRYEISVADNIGLWCAVDLAVSE